MRAPALILSALLLSPGLTQGSSSQPWQQGEPSPNGNAPTLTTRLIASLGAPRDEHLPLAREMLAEAERILRDGPRSVDAGQALVLSKILIACLEFERDPASDACDLARRQLSNHPQAPYYLPLLLGSAIDQGRLNWALDLASWAYAQLELDAYASAALHLDWIAALRRAGQHEEASLRSEQLEAILEEKPAEDLDYQRSWTSLKIRAARLAFEADMTLGLLDRANRRLSRLKEHLEQHDELTARVARARGLGTEELADPLGPLLLALSRADYFLASRRPGPAIRVLDQFVNEGHPLGPRQRAKLELMSAGARLEHLWQTGKTAPEHWRPVAQELDRLGRGLQGEPDGARASSELVGLLLELALESAELSEVEQREARQLAEGHLERADRFLAARSDALRWNETRAIHASVAARWALAFSPDLETLERHHRTTGKLLDQLFKEWSQLLHRPGGVGFLHPMYRRELLVVHTQLALRLNGHEQAGVRSALQELLRIQEQGTLWRRLGLGSELSLESIRTALEPDHAVLIYLPGRHRSLLFAFDTETIVPHVLGSPYRIFESRRRALAALLAEPDVWREDSDSHGKRLGEATADLASFLFPKGLPDLLADRRRLTFVGQTYLDGVPIESLTPPGSTRALGLSHAIDVAPSPGLWAALSQRGASPTSSVPHLLAGVALRSDEQALALSPHAKPVDREVETAALERLVAGWPGPRQALPGMHWESLRASMLAAPKGSVMHLVAHGGHDASRERGACLLLASRDGERSEVYSEDIEALERVPEVVVLSTCAAARAPLRRGDDALGHLGGAFLFAGARCVILTRASVTLEDSLAVGELLQAGLAQGLGPAEALRQARVSLVRSGGPLDPFRLARLQAIGAGGSR